MTMRNEPQFADSVGRFYSLAFAFQICYFNLAGFNPSCGSIVRRSKAPARTKMGLLYQFILFEKVQLRTITCTA
jgi:hypothetical protein